MISDGRIKVRVIHRNPLVSMGLRAALADADIEVIYGDCAGEELAPETIKARERVRVVVADYDAALEMLAPDVPRHARVIIVTDDDSEVSIRRAVERGVAGYLLLSSSLEMVVRGVRTVHSGGTALDASVVQKMVASLRCDPLTSRQTEVLRLMMMGLSDKAIARRLTRSVGTAKSHVKAILTKLDSTSRTEAVAVARRRGLVHEKVGSP